MVDQLAEEEFEALLFARTYLFGLFHKVLGGEPTVEVIEALFSRSTIDVVDEYADTHPALGRLKDFLEQGVPDSSEVFADVASGEYVRMFVGPGRPEVLPWSTPYVEKQPVMYGIETVAVRTAYADYGLRLRRINKEPDDHIAIQCSFLYEMAKKTRALVADGRRDSVRDLIAAQAAFVDLHLATWLSEFARQAGRAKSGRLYPLICEALDAFVRADREFLSEAAVWLSGTDLDSDADVHPDVQRAAGAQEATDSWLSQSEGASGNVLLSTDASDAVSLVPVEFERALLRIEALRPHLIEDCELVPVAVREDA